MNGDAGEGDGDARGRSGFRARVNARRTASIREGPLMKERMIPTTPPRTMHRDEHRERFSECFSRPALQPETCAYPDQRRKTTATELASGVQLPARPAGHQHVRQVELEHGKTAGERRTAAEPQLRHANKEAKSCEQSLDWVA